MSRTLISILAGLGAMFGWGVSDLFANTASDKFGHLKAFLYSQLAGIALMILVAILWAGSFSLSPSLIPILILSSVGYAAGYLLFYRGFEIGNVSVVSAVINLQQPIIIAISYFIFGQTLTSYQIPAIIAILLGITLVSVNFNDLRSGKNTLVKGVKETIAAAVFFGVLYWPTTEYIVERSDWMASSLYIKLLAVILVFILATVQKQNLSINKSSNKTWLLLAIVGILEAIAVLSIGFGGAYGDNIIVAPIASSLSIVTISLAMIFLKEKITKTQGLGIIITIVGILLTAF